MRLARALELTHNIASTPQSIEGLDSLLDPSLVEPALEQAGVATLRKRRLPLEMMLWCVISMAFFRRMGDAILDRLVHNAYRIKLKGESMRRRATKLTTVGTSD